MNIEGRLSRIEQFTAAPVNPAESMTDDEIITAARGIIARGTGIDTSAMSVSEIISQARSILAAR